MLANKDKDKMKTKQRKHIHSFEFIKSDREFKCKTCPKIQD